MSSQSPFAEEPSRSPSRSNDPAPNPVRILTIVLLYAGFAALWILLSDKALAWLFTDPSDLALISTLKGLAFVAVTSLLLYVSMRRLLGPTHTAISLLNGRRQIIISLCLLALAISALTAAGISYSVTQHREAAITQLRAIVDLKSRQIEDWLTERYGDARFLQSNPFWSDLYHRGYQLNDPASRSALQHRMNEFRMHKAFDGILLFDAQGQFLWASQNIVYDRNSPIGAAASRQERQVIHVGPYVDAAGDLHLDFLAPLKAQGDASGPIAVLRVDPATHLFPLLRTWPGPSPSGETLLLRRDGDQVLYLNELRHQPGSAGSLRLSPSQEKLFAAKILGSDQALGKLIKGVDYRGQAAFGIARAVRGTDWYLAAKLDESELFSGALKDALWIGLAGLLGLFIATASVVLFRQRQELSVALRESRIKAEKLRALELLGALSEASSDAIFAKDKEGRYLLFNPEAARLTGVDAQWVLGRDDSGLFPPEQAALIMANDRSVMLGNRTASFHETLTTVDGKIILQATKGPLHDAGGNVIGIFGISRDITELKQAEAALQEIKQRLHLALQAGRGGAWDWNLNTGEVWWSQELHDLYGIKSGTPMVLDNSMAGVHEEDRARLRQAMQQSTERREDFQCEFRIRHPQRGVLWMSSRGRLVFDASGRAIFLRGITLDITERKRAEIDLADREKYLRTILQTTADGFCTLDADGRIMDVNEAYCRMTGYARNELIGMNVEALDAGEAPSEMARRIPRILTHGAELFETRQRRKDGTHFDVELSLTSLEVEGRRLVCLCRDITERKKAEAETAKLQTRILQAQKMESIGNLAGGIAHDFNNILFPILGFSELLLDDLAPHGPKAEKVKEIINAARRGSELVRQILAFSRQSKHKLIPVRVDHLLKEVLKLVRATIPSDILISQKIQKDCGLVLADPTQLHQIVMNLITNAYHAVEQNRGTIEVALEEAELGADEVAERLIAPGRYTIFSISDTGSGIDPANMEKVFEPYFTTKEKGKGTGLGLSVVYGIVKEHKGEIKIYSELGKGTTVRVYLPLMGGQAEAASPEAITVPAPGSERILIVDDEAAVVRTQEHMLGRLGYRVSAHTSSLDALNAFQADPNAFDAVLTDMTMPNLTGDQLAKAVRAIRPGIPIIICTGFSERIDPEKATAQGIEGFLMKPVVRSEMARMVRQVLDQAKAPPH